MLHWNGIQVFSTFIVKHHVRSIALSQLLDKDLQGEYIFTTQLSLATETYGLGGWLMNLEALFTAEGFRPGDLQAFLKELAGQVVELAPGGHVIWLREPRLPATSIMVDSMNRVPDICTRIVYFGWESLGGGIFGVAEVLSAIRKVGTAAPFAPG